MRIWIGRRTALSAALVAIVGCGEADAPSAAELQVRDSADIRIVTSPPSDAVYARLADEPALSVGELDGAEEYLFGWIASVARDGEGNLVVADGGVGEIRVFDGGGRHLRTFGGKGEGPGEFDVLNGAWPVPGGGVLAVDRRLRRVTRFDAEGSLLGVAELAGTGEMGMFAPRGLAGAETLLSQVTVLGMPSTVESSMRELEETLADEGAVVLFLRHRVDGALVDTLARRPGERMSMSTTGSGDRVAVQLMTVPFSLQPAGTGSPQVVAVTGSGQYDIALFDADGVPRTIVRLDEAPVPRTEAHLEAFVRHSGRRVPDEESIRAMMETYRDMPMPERLPAYTDLLFADTGELWARRYRLPGDDTTRWDVFGEDGQHLGRVEVPASFRIREVSGGQVAGIATDELGVERVELRDLIFGGR